MTGDYAASQFAANWCYYLFDATWQASLIAALTIIVVNICRFLPANLRYGMLIVAALKFAIPALPSFWVGISSITQSINPIPAISQDNLTDWSIPLIIMHIVGMIFATIRLLRQHQQLKMIRRDGIEIKTGELADEFVSLSRALNFNQPPLFLSSPQASIPFAFGVRYQTVVLPEAAVKDLSLSELRPVLAHELAHLRSWDQWVNWCQAILGIIWWFNPLYRWLSNSLREVREECRDDEVLALGFASSRSYSTSLLAVAALMRKATHSPIALNSIGHHPHPLAVRLARIANSNISRRTRLSTAQFLLLGLIALLLLPSLTINTRSDSAAQNRTGTVQQQSHREAHQHSHNHH